MPEVDEAEEVAQDYWQAARADHLKLGAIAQHDYHCDVEAEESGAAHYSKRSQAEVFWFQSLRWLINSW